MIAGDLFDAWVRDVDDLRSWAEFFTILAAISNRYFAYVAGNHDSAALCKPGAPGPAAYSHTVVNVGGEHWYVEHGHLTGKWAPVFRVLDKIDRWPCFRKVVRWAMKRPTLANAGRNVEDQGFTKAVVEKARLRGCKVAIHGHDHIQAVDVNDFAGFRIMRVNPGSCIDKAQWIVYHNGQFYRESA